MVRVESGMISRSLFLLISVLLAVVCMAWPPIANECLMVPINSYFDSLIITQRGCHHEKRTDHHHLGGMRPFHLEGHRAVSGVLAPLLHGFAALSHRAID